MSSNSTSIGISKVLRYKMKRSCTYSMKSQCSEAPHFTLSHSESSQQCSERKEAWWSCPFCAFHIETLPASRCDARPTRCKKAHLQAEHPECDHSQTMAAKSERGKEERMNAIRQSKEAKIVDFIDKYEGPHMLAVDGYGVQCSWCDWKGRSSKVTQQCTLRRGGLKLSTHQWKAKKTAGDGACMWRSFSTYAGIAWQEIRRKVCDAFTNHGG